MNERIEYCLYEAGLTAQGCWEELDDYAKEGIERFAKLIIKECADLVDDPEDHDDLYVSDGDMIKKHFGVDDDQA